MNRLRQILFASAVFLALFSCSKGREDIVKGKEDAEPVLKSINVTVSSVVLPQGESVEILFRVEDRDYKFNYAVSTSGCQIKLLLSGGREPDNYRLKDVFFDGGRNVYVSVIEDSGTGEDYDDEAYLAIFPNPGSSAFIKSSLFRVKAETDSAGTVKTGLPVVYVTTSNGAGITSKTEFVTASFSVRGTKTLPGMDAVSCRVRGRGNTTWTWPKKPYLVALDEKASVLGMPKHKRWVLLANFMDRTLMRNLVSMKVASMTGLDWTPGCVPVELVLNGQHKGSYLLIEQVRVDKNRVNITEMTKNDNAGEAVTGGYLLELDFHYDNDVQWTDEHGGCDQWGRNGGIPFGVKYPDSDDLTDQQLAYIKKYVSDTAEAIYGDNFTDPEKGYAKYIDVDSFIDYWIVFEVMGNHELRNPGSVFMHKDRGGKLVAGPCWDFDWGVLSFRTSPQAEYDLLNDDAIWYARLFQDSAFRAKVRARFQELLPELKKIPDYMDECEKLLTESAKLNFAMWNPAEDASMNDGHIINGDENMTFHNAVARLKDNYKKRLDVISRKL